MPSIPIHLPSATPTRQNNPLPTILRTPSGLSLLEIQGTIHTPTLQPEGPTTALSPDTCTVMPVGRLVFPNYTEATSETGVWMKTVHLYVGLHQRLTGEVKKLAMPLAVMRRRDDDVRTEEAGGDELEIVDLVYYKMIFSSRPEPVGDWGRTDQFLWLQWCAMPEYAMWCKLLCTVYPYKDPSEVFSGALHTFCNFMKISSKESKRYSATCQGFLGQFKRVVSWPTGFWPR